MINRHYHIRIEAVPLKRAEMLANKEITVLCATVSRKSWFSDISLKPRAAENLLNELSLDKSKYIVTSFSRC